MKILKNFVILVILLGAFACKEDQEYFFTQSDEIVFQFEYTNYAWGAQHYGFFITPDGSKYTYNNPEGWIFDEEGEIKNEDFLTDLALCTEEGTVDTDELNRMKALVLKVDESQLSKSENTMYDAGSENYSFYIRDEIKGTYRRITLLNRGDYFQKNSDDDAEEIANWLIELNNGGIFSD